MTKNNEGQNWEMKKKKHGGLSQIYKEKLYLVPIFYDDFLLDSYSFGFFCIGIKLWLFKLKFLSLIEKRESLKRKRREKVIGCLHFHNNNNKKKYLALISFIWQE